MIPYIILVLILPVEILCVILIGLTYYHREILSKYDRSSVSNDFSTTYAVLAAIIQSEIDLYERDVFENSRPITNANFENYYNDLAERIKSKISPELMHNLQHYITEEAIFSYIARTVRQYLVQYVKDPL